MALGQNCYVHFITMGLAITRLIIKKSAGAVAATTAIASVASASTPPMANAKIRIGFIGPGGRGFGAL